jgi:hypothetical protein
VIARCQLIIVLALGRLFRIILYIIPWIRQITAVTALQVSHTIALFSSKNAGKPSAQGSEGELLRLTSSFPNI